MTPEQVADIYRRMGYEVEISHTTMHNGHPNIYVRLDGYTYWDIVNPLGSDPDALALLHWCAEEPRGWKPWLDWHSNYVRCTIHTSLLGDVALACAIVDGTDPAAVRQAIVQAVAQAVEHWKLEVQP